MTTETITQLETVQASNKFDGKLLYSLPILALVVEIFTPILMAYGLLPSAARFLSDIAVAAMLGLVVLYVLAFDYVPKALLVIVGITLIWIPVAIINGQGLLATAWGWWQLFKYPFAGLFIYLYPGWPKGIARSLPKYLVVLLGIQVLVQIGQYLSGMPIGDAIGGTLSSEGGVAKLLMVTLFTLGMALGSWLAKGEWKLLIWVFLLGIVSSTLAENKLFAVSIALMTLATIAIYFLRGQRLRRMWALVMASVLVFIGFITLYNLFAAEIGGAARIETYYLDSRALDDYLNLRIRGSGGEYNLGRNFALVYGWNTIKHDPVTMLFGLGMGSRSESSSLGVVGQGLSDSYYGVSTGSSLTVMLQEYGILGLGLGFIIVLWLVFRLYRDAARYPYSELNALRYGLLLFSLFWPLWLWYSKVWMMRAPMLMFWMTLGYIFNREIVAYFDSKQPEEEPPLEEKTDVPLTL